MSDRELKNIIQAALLVAGQPLTIDKMLALFPEELRPSVDDARAALAMLEEECMDSGIELKQIDRAYRFQTREKYASWIGRLSEERPPRYSRALLETLAIVTYRQPVTRAEIEEIRGVTVSTDIIKTLLGRGWVRQVGQRDVPGKPGLYGTTREFLEHFNLKTLSELPPLAELRDIDKIAAELNLQVAASEASDISTTPSPSNDRGIDTNHEDTDERADEEPPVEADSDTDEADTQEHRADKITVNGLGVHAEVSKDRRGSRE